MPANRGGLTVAFYVVLGVVIIANLFRLFALVLPDGIASTLSNNSEAFVLTLIMALWIQFVRLRLQQSPRQWTVTLTVAALCVAVGAALSGSDLVSQVKTHSETFLAAGALIPYVQLRRPLARWLPATVALVTLAVIVVGEPTAFVTDSAEALAAVVLTPLALDVFDRAILDRTATTVLWQRILWYLTMATVPLVCTATNNGAEYDGLLGTVLAYTGRCTEVFICVLLLTFYFTIVHGRTGPRIERQHSEAVSAY